MDKLNRYFLRTVEHIHRVQNNMVFLVVHCRPQLAQLGIDEEGLRILMHNVMIHDQSKFSTVQFRPYVELTEYYHQRKVLGNKEYQYPNEQTKVDVERAVKHHYQFENHHPEALRFEQAMSKYAVIETVCDLQAMAQEFNEGTCRKYFEEVWKPKQVANFSRQHSWEWTIALMDEIIKCFEDLTYKGIIG